MVGLIKVCPDCSTLIPVTAVPTKCPKCNWPYSHSRKPKVNNVKQNGKKKSN